jgi:hypothetical protein
MDKQDIISALGMYGIRSFYETEIGAQLGKINGSGDVENCSCPFHNDSSPSFSINIKTGLFNCYGCGEKGSVFDFYNKRYGGGFVDGMRYFCHLAGLEWTGNGNGKKKGASAPADKFGMKWGAAKANGIEKGLPYLESRGIKKETIIPLADRLGFSGKAYAGALNGKSVFTKSIAVPMWEINPSFAMDKIVGIQNIFPDPPWTNRKGGKKEKLKKRHEKDSRPERGATWFGDHASGTYIIAESVIDGLSIYQACPDAFIIALFSAGNAGGLKGYLPGDKNIVCFFDNDAAGEKALRKIAGMYPDAKTVLWDGCITKDANELIVKTIDGKEQIEMMLRNAVSVDLTAPIKDTGEHLAVADISECETPSEAVEAINEKYCVIKLGGAVRIMEEFIDPVFGRPDLEFMSVPDFKALLGNIDIDGIKAVNYWLKSPERRQYERMVFAPGQDVGPNIYNLWKGFDVEPIPPPSEDDTGCDLFLSLAYNVIADQNEYLYQWVLAWLADMVKNPGGKRPETSLALQGDMGTGKSFFVEYFGGIFGQHFLTVDSAERLVDKFNFILKDAIPVHCDEGFFAGNKQMAAILKHLVTGDVNVIEPKNVNAIKVRNYVRLFFSTNSDWVVPAGFNERRFAVLKVSNAFRQDEKFFGEAAKERDSGGRGHLLHYLLNFEPDPSLDINITKIPKTEALFNQIIASAETIEKFWFELLSDIGQDVFGGWTVSEVLYDRYILFADRIDGQKYKATKSKFTREIKRLCPSIHSCTQTVDGVVCRGYRLESLEVCRKEFQDQMCVKITWPKG